MGGFLLCRRQTGESLTDLETRYQRSLEVFERKKLKLCSRVPRENFVVYRFDRLLSENPELIEFDDGDFVFCTGTFLYDGKSGNAALTALYYDHKTREISESKIAGNFCVVIYHKGLLRLINDFCGYYPIYMNDSGDITSNSYLAVARQSHFKSLNSQAFYEFMLHGFFVDKETLLPDIEVLDSTASWQLWPEIQSVARRPWYERLPDHASLEDLVERFDSDLCDYFSVLANVFNGQIGSALSGGYDTRHMLGLLRRAGQCPYLHVYGDSTSADVRIAKDIAIGEQLQLEHVDKAKRERLSIDELEKRFEHDVYFFDGIKPLGVFDDGSDFATRLARAQNAPCQLNGAGGEIYREIWNISNRQIDILEFLRMRYDRGSYAFCRGAFDHDDYFDRFAGKIRALLQIDRDWMTRSEVEMLFPFLRNRFASVNNALNNQISPSLVPYMETFFVYPTFDVPIRQKYYGRLHAALISAVDPALAAYDSSYGINFGISVPFQYRCMLAAHRHIPLSIRLARRVVASKKKQSVPYFLQDDFVRRVIDTHNMQIADYVDPNLIDDPEILSRALSVEALLQRI